MGSMAFGAKTTFVARSFPPNIGGGETLNFELYCELIKYGNVNLIANKRNRSSLLFPLFYIRSLWRILITQRNGIVLLSDAGLSILAPLIKILTNNKVIMKLHGKDLTYKNLLHQAILGLSIRHVDLAICISNATKVEAVRRGFGEERCVVIPPGVRMDDHGKRVPKDVAKEIASSEWSIDLNGHPVLLSVGRLERRKGFHWLVAEVIPILLKKTTDIRYLIVGGGSLDTYVASLISLNDFDANVKQLGIVSQSQLDILYACADVLLVPNIALEGDFEGFGLVVLEANSHDIPAVATRVDGLQEAVTDGANGLLIEQLDGPAFAEAVSKLIWNPEEALNNGGSPRDHIKELYCWKNISEQYVRAMNSVLPEEVSASDAS